MNAQMLILIGVTAGLMLWQALPRWRQVLRYVPAAALAVSVLGAFISLGLPTFLPPVLSGAGATVAMLQVMKGGAKGSRRR